MTARRESHSVPCFSEKRRHLRSATLNSGLPSTTTRLATLFAPSGIAGRRTRFPSSRMHFKRRAAPTRTCSTRAAPVIPTSTASGCSRCCRSEEHTSELQSHHDLVCRLLLEKKKKTINPNKKYTSQTKKK